MFKYKDPKDLVLALLKRSECNVQVAAVLADNWGIHSWGWNGSGSDGLGEHAEAACFRRSNRQRISGSTLYVAAVRRRNRRIVTAKPCLECQPLVRRCRRVVFRDKDGVWKKEIQS